MTSKNKKFLFGLFVIIVVYFWWKGTLFLDPDFGWHVQMGKYILSHGIPSTDPFSYTMASYPFVDHEWLTNVAFAKAMGISNYTLFAGIFALFAVAAYTLQIFTIPEKRRQFAVPFLLLAFLGASGFVGIRPQVMTWFFFSVVLFVIRDEVRFGKYGWFLPLLFLLWVNLHGGFAVGIVALTLAAGYWWYKSPSAWLRILSIYVLSIAATFAMPYGWRGWWEVWMQITDGNLRWAIMEWVPTILVPSLTIWSFIVFSVMFVARYFKRFSLLDLLLYGGLFVAGLSSMRHIPLWLVIALPMTIEAMAYFYQEITTIKYAVGRFWKLARVFLVYLVVLVLFDSQNIWYALGFFGKQTTYPADAVTYLTEHTPQGQLFSVYDWGGYLIGNFPEKKVFIDGRMPSWRWNANIQGESNYVFEEYRDVLDGTVPFETIAVKYGIDTLLLPLPGEMKKDAADRWVFNFAKNVLGLPLREDVGVTRVVDQVKKAGWSVVYQDETAVIYKKK